MRPVIEVCVDRIDSVVTCSKAGVDRIELCAALSEGGLTPSFGFLRQARQIFRGKIMMMIRPRAGDFLYQSDEIEIMKKDIALAKSNGADGIVFGCLLADGSIDAPLCRELIEDAGSLDITFHRAFDASADLDVSLETLIELGIPRVLTSGGQPDVWRGRDALQSLVRQANSRIAILAGGGITADRIAEIIGATGLREVHLSARTTRASAMQFRRDDIPMGASQVMPEYEHRIADLDLLKNLCQS